MPQGNPEKEQDGRVDHKIKKDETLSGIAPLYEQSVPDILLTNPTIRNPDVIDEGGSLRILSEERRTSLETIAELQADADKATSPADKDEKTKALKLAVQTDLQSAGKNEAYTPEKLKTSLDQREADLIALGPKTDEYKKLVQSERKTVESNLNAVFEPLSKLVNAAQQNPAEWGKVQTELTDQFAKLAKDAPDGGEAAINSARETLKTFGPSDKGFVEALDASGREILVNRPAKRVQDAFREGKNDFKGFDGADAIQFKKEDGAARAAKVLNEVTKNVTDETAVLIVQQANQPIEAFGNKDTKVLDVIQQTIGQQTAINSGALPDSLAGRYVNPETNLWRTLAQHDLFANYSEALGRISKAPGGAKLIDDSAKSISKAVKDTTDNTFADWEAKLPEKARTFSLEDKKKIGKEIGIPYPQIKPVDPEAAGEPFRKAVAGGNDPTLSLAVVRELNKSGNTSSANAVFDAVIKGTDDLTKNSQNVVGDFAKDHLVVANDWKSSLSAKQLTDGIDDSIANKQGSKDKMDEQGARIFRTLSALHAAEDGLKDLKGLDGLDRYKNATTGLEQDEKSQFAVSNSEQAWTEMGKAYIEATAKPETEPVSAAPTLYWSGRAVIGMHRTVAAYEALGGNKAYKPPTPGSIDTASRMSPGQFDPKLAQSSSLLLNGPNAATDPKARKAAIESLSKAFDGSKFDPRAGITTASGFGKGLAGVQGLLYLGSAKDNFATPGLLTQSFGVWLTAGIAQEAAQLSAGSVRSLIERGTVAKGGFLDKATRFAEVSGTSKWGWFSKYFDRAGGALMVAYTLDYAAKGKWANSAFAATTTVGTFLSLMKSPKAGLWGAGLAVVGIIGEAIYNQYRRSEAANYYEGPTERFLIKAGFPQNAAKELSNHDGDGNSVGLIIEPLAKELGMTPQALTESLRATKDMAKLREFVAGVHQTKPDDKGNYPMTAPKRLEPLEMPDGGTVPRDPSFGRPRTIPELAEWTRENLVLTS
ncbi:LysM peptidoglycan-binding domain-containing protein [Sinorhizobium americanum]|uniref:LysM peptidoglycan-binding domain-containing protein n=1 Tax=Sinorhizobium americanum TaxID=194963 RepID=UPI001F1E9511|nr:LysM domain-containing protein [Sinorhizobium americanum]